MLRPILLLFLMLVSCQAPTASSAASAEASMRSYWFGMIKRGPQYGAEMTAEASAELQAAHRARIGELTDQGKMVLAGPFGEQPGVADPYVGLFIYTVPTREEAEALAASDPAVAFGRLRVEIVEWWGVEGITYPGAPEPSALGGR